MAVERTFGDVSIDRVREYWNARPCNIRHSPKPIGTREYFDDVERRKYFVEPHIPEFAEFARWSERSVLEIGCGIGTDTVRDLGDRVQIRVGNAEELPAIVPPQRFDLVYSFGVIHHSPNPARIVEHIRSYMDATSELRLMVYARVSYKLFWIMKEEGVWDMSRIDELIARNSEAQTGCPVTYTYTDDSVRELLAGFTVTNVRKAHIFTWDIDAYRRYEYKKAREWATVSDAELAILERELGWHLLVRARLR